MSILIKGMKMPKSCDECQFCNDGGICAALQIDLLGDGEELENSWYIPEGYKSDRCPLTELPDHGDLIDKNRMIDVLHHGNKCVSEIQKDAKDEASISYCQGVMIGYTNSIVALDGAPVVIPAERS